MDGWWEADRVDELFHRLAQLEPERIPIPAGLRWINGVGRLVNRQRRSRARQVAEHHYDLGNDLFIAMLDRRLTYTCGYWANASTLEEAQETKLDLVCRKLDLRPMLVVACYGLLFAPSVIAQADRGDPNARVWATGEWVDIGGVPPALDSDLLGPGLLQGHGQKLYVYDYHDAQLKAFDYQGNLLWRLGRRGQGPNEFQNPTDLQVGPEGSIWIVDPENVRLSIVSGAGRLLHNVHVPPLVRRCAPITTTRCWALLTSGSSLATLLDVDGSTSHDLPAPPPLTSLHPFVREGLIAPVPRTGGAVIAFLHGDVWISVSPTARSLDVANHRGLEPIEFPQLLSYPTERGVVTRLDPAARRAARSLAVHEGRVFVLFGGRGQVIDVYDLTSGRYIESYELPLEAVRIAVSSDGDIAALLDGMMPSSAVWRWEPR